MRYFSESNLRSAGQSFVRERLANVKTASWQARVTIFLSHSHLDRDIVLGLIGYFDTLGVSIYVDWNDSSMPRDTSRVTASKLKKRIRSSQVFMVLATRNAMRSNWVPWEVGLADQMKGEDKVLIIGVADPSGKFAGAEYMQLYRLVALPDYVNQPTVYSAEARAEESSLADFLRTTQ